MAGQYEKLLAQFADLKNKVSTMILHGTVKEVKGNMVRMIIGKGSDGKDVLGPWVNTGNHRGGATDQRFYKEGQNVTCINPGGDPEQAIVMPFAPNKEHGGPDHAPSSGQDAETYQLGDHREAVTKDGIDEWLEAPEQKQQQTDDSQKDSSGGGGEIKGTSAGNAADQQKQQDKKLSLGGDKARMKRRMNSDKGITHRVGSGETAFRTFVSKDVVKLKYGKGSTAKHFRITKDGIFASEAIQIDPEDQFPDDDA